MILVIGIQGSPAMQANLPTNSPVIVVNTHIAAKTVPAKVNSAFARCKKECILANLQHEESTPLKSQNFLKNYQMKKRIYKFK